MGYKKIKTALIIAGVLLALSTKFSINITKNYYGKDNPEAVTTENTTYVVKLNNHFISIK